MALYISLAVIIIPALYLLSAFIFDILLRGFLPLIPSRPWVVKEIMAELEIPGENPKMLAFSTGRSGFFHSMEKKYPGAELVGVESSLFPFLVAKVQSRLRRTKIAVQYRQVGRVDVSDFDFVYSHLYPDQMIGLGKKLKFECKPGTKIVSTGFNIPGLNAQKIVDLPDRKGKLDWLSKNQKLFQRKSKKYKKEKKAFFYEI